MTTRVSPTIPVASRVAGYSYAIRNIVDEAKKVEATGRTVHYLNIGDPVAFGFQTPPHLIAAVERAMRAGENGYVPSAGILPAREAVADEYTRRGHPMTPDRVILTDGTSEAIDMALSALLDEGDEALVPLPTYPLYTAILSKIRAKARFYRTDPDAGWAPDLDHLRSLISPRTRVLVTVDPNNPTGAVYPESLRRDLLALSESYGLVLLADEVYSDVVYDGPVPPLGSLDPEAAVISFSSLSKAFFAPGWRTGWLALGGGDQLSEVKTAVRRLADGRLCSTGPMQHAIVPALTGDRSHQTMFRTALRERARLIADRLNAVPGMSCVEPRGAFYAFPRLTLPPGRTDEQFILGLLQATGILCVHGSGFGMPPEAGTFRLVFLASPDLLGQVCDGIEAYATEFLA